MVQIVLALFITAFHLNDNLGGELVLENPFNESELSSLYAADSIIAVVTGGWGFANYRDEAHAQYLSRILDSYFEMCSYGFDVTLILLCHESYPREWIDEVLGGKKRDCGMSTGTMNLSVRTAPFQALRGKSFGTLSDLAIRHHQIFLKEIENYDLFISQEDDVLFTLEHVRHFIRTQRWLNFVNLKSKKKPMYHTYLFPYENMNDTIYVDWRLRHGSVYAIEDQLFYETAHIDTGCCGYMIFRDDLKNVVANYGGGWCDALTFSEGEFNPSVASWNMLQSTYKLVLPLVALRQSGFHHLPDTYVHAHDSIAVNEEFPFLAPATIAEQQAIFGECTRISNARHRALDIHTHGDACYACLDEGGTVTFMSQLIQSGSQLRRHHLVNVTYSCDIKGK